MIIEGGPPKSGATLQVLSNKEQVGNLLHTGRLGGPLLPAYEMAFKSLRCAAYFGASEATIASKRGTPRSGSQSGLRRKWP